MAKKAETTKSKTPNPTQGVFIGIGGTGVITVAHLKAKILRHYGGDLEKMYIDNHFIFLDTDETTFKEINQDQTLNQIFGKSNVPIDRKEFINLGETKPFQIYNTAKTSEDANSQRLLEWIIDPDTKGNYTIPNTQLQAGAGAARIAGRTSVYKNWDTIITKVKAGINKMTGYENAGKTDKEKLEESKPSIWVFGSSNGGTGSSAILDVLYIVDRVFQKKFNNDPYLRLILYMPKPFMAKNEENLNYPLNAFSTFWELNAFRYDAMNENDGKKFQYFSCKPNEDGWETITGKWNVYSYMLAIDAETDKNRPINLDDLFINTAEMCFYMHISTAGDTMVSRLDNNIKNTKLINSPRTDRLTDFKWTSSLIAAGYKAICKPDDLLIEYIKTRFLFDFYEYGLLGFTFDDIHTSAKDRENAKKVFADNFIFKYLVEAENSLEYEYKKLFANVKIPDYEPKDIKNEWDTIWTTYKQKVNAVKTLIENGFSSMSDTLSKENYLAKIKKAINTGIEENIKDYGLRYIHGLIHRVDDEYCAGYISDLEKVIPRNEEILEKENDILKIVSDKTRDLTKLKKSCKEYSDLIHSDLIKKHTIGILKNLTELSDGYLEIIRRESSESIGLGKIIKELESKSSKYRDDYFKLAKKFKATNDEVFTTFIPYISDFVDESNNWIDKDNLFQDLYADIVALDTTGKASVLHGSCGYPPLRISSDGKGLKDILKDMIFANEDSFFVNISLENSYNIGTLHNTFSDACEKHIMKKINSGKVEKWLKESLENTFDTIYYDVDRRNLFFQNFKQSIPVLFPQRAGSVGAKGGERFLFTGASKVFATKLGYDKDDDNHQYKDEQNITNRFLVFKFEVGHNLYDYHGFDDISSLYYKHRLDIENNVYGCHIHKDFSKLDLEKITSYVDKNFLELGLYDSFFEKLASEDVETYKSLFKMTSVKSGGNKLIERSSKNKKTKETSENQEETLAKHNKLIEVKLLGAKNFQLKCAKLKFETTKIEIVEILEYTFDTDDFEVFCKEVKSFSKNYLNAIKVIEKALDKKSAYKSKYLTSFANNFESITDDTISNLLDAAIENTLDDSLDKHNDLSTEILESLEEFNSNNIFK